MTAASEYCGSLDGRHLDITTVHALGFIDMGYEQGELWPASQWHGFIIDQIRWIAQQANFTYTLHSPSGLGADCLHNSAMDGLLPYAAQYNCGVNDVIDLNRTDMYWAMYFVTVPRLQDAIFTQPFMSNVGLTIALPAGQENWMDEASKIFAPFSPALWLCTLGTTLFVSVVMWLMEHSHESWQHVKTGYVTAHAFRRGIGPSIEQSWLSLLSHAMFAPMSTRGMTFSMLWCFFSVVWMSAYTAELSANLIEPRVALPVDSIPRLVEAQSRSLIGRACIKASTAYGLWLQATYPSLQILEIPGSNEELAEAVADGRCSALIDAFAHIDHLAHDQRYCSVNIVQASEPLHFGLQDHAVGLKPSMELERDVISCWISELRSCSPDMSPHAWCYNQLNMAALWDKWVSSKTCTSGLLTSASDDGRLTIVTFGFLFATVWGVGLLFFACELCSRKMADRCRAANASSRDLIAYVRTHHPECWKESPALRSPSVFDRPPGGGTATAAVGGGGGGGEKAKALDVDAFCAKWRRAVELRAEVSPYVASHLVRLDIGAWSQWQQLERQLVYEEGYKTAQIASGINATIRHSASDAPLVDDDDFSYVDDGGVAAAVAEVASPTRRCGPVGMRGIGERLSMQEAPRKKVFSAIAERGSEASRASSSSSCGRSHGSGGSAQPRASCESRASATPIIMTGPAGMDMDGFVPQKPPRDSLEDRFSDIDELQEEGQGGLEGGLAVSAGGGAAAKQQPPQPQPQPQPQPPKPQQPQQPSAASSTAPTMPSPCINNKGCAAGSRRLRSYDGSSRTASVPNASPCGLAAVRASQGGLFGGGLKPMKLAAGRRAAGAAQPRHCPVAALLDALEAVVRTVVLQQLDAQHVQRVQNHARRQAAVHASDSFSFKSRQGASSKLLAKLVKGGSHSGGSTGSASAGSGSCVLRAMSSSRSRNKVDAERSER